MDTETALPLYEQVRRQLVADIVSGRFPEGQFLPSETMLCDRFGVSRITLRRAVSELCAEGRLIRQQGRGTLVVPQKLTQSIALSGFSETMAGQGREPGHYVLHEDWPKQLADEPEFTQPVCFDRVLEADGRPITLENLCFDGGRFDQAARIVAGGGSFFGALETCHEVTPARACRKIDVGFASPAEAAILDITAAQPVYHISKKVYDAQDLLLARSRMVTPCHLVTLTFCI